MKCGSPPMATCFECGRPVTPEAGACEYCGAHNEPGSEDALPNLSTPVDVPPRLPRSKETPSRLSSPVESPSVALPPIATLGEKQAGRSGQSKQQEDNRGASPKPVTHSPPKIEELESEFVDFEEARYKAYCPDCESLFYVKGTTLSKRKKVQCPNHDSVNIGGTHELSKLSLMQADNEVIVYSVIKDFFSYNGRISVTTYWKSILVALVPMLIIGVICSFTLPSLSPLLWFAILSPLWVKRLHDHNFSQEWAIIPGVSAVCMVINSWLLPSMIRGESYPLLSIIALLALIGSLIMGVMISCVPGAKRINRFGQAPNKVKVKWL